MTSKSINVGTDYRLSPHEFYKLYLMIEIKIVTSFDLQSPI